MPCFRTRSAQNADLGGDGTCAGGNVGDVPYCSRMEYSTSATAASVTAFCQSSRPTE